MKIKSFIACGALLLSAGAATTSCTDMFTAENNLVSTDLAPKDTLYQMMGIVQRMAKLADRTVLLGEVRADLVDVNATVASTHIQQLKANDVTTDNIYNQPADYYDVINNCNIYLANVDPTISAHGNAVTETSKVVDRYYGREICAAKCFRAWCYLELAKNYGKVPFVTEPVLTADAAEQIVADASKLKDMKEILDFCIADLASYADEPDNFALLPQYGASFGGFSSYSFFIPVRALLGELYLWRGAYTQNVADYKNAIAMYHDYLTYKGEERSVGQYSTSGSQYGHVYWEKEYPSSNIETSGSYGSVLFQANAIKQQCAVLACDTTQTPTDLRALFCSQYSNNYYPALSPSQRIRNISKAQDYCYYKVGEDGTRKAMIFSKAANEYPQSDEIYVGDLRLSSVYSTTDNQSNAQFNAAYASDAHYVTKWTTGLSALSDDRRQVFVPILRTNILYLHLAEALNYAGFTETAFAVLKYGLTSETMMDRDIISKAEFDGLAEIKCGRFTLDDQKYIGEFANGKNSAALWPTSVFARPEKTSSSTIGGTISSLATNVQTGVHCLGSGDADYNDQYVPYGENIAKQLKEVKFPTKPTYDKKTDDKDSTNYKAALAEYELAYEAALADKQWNYDFINRPENRASLQAHVAKLILDEEALEGMFEGYRFYDLLRYQMADGKVAGTNATITLPDYINTKFGGVDNMTGKKWYLPLPTR